jgi:hypothetical protein
MNLSELYPLQANFVWDNHILRASFKFKACQAQIIFFWFQDNHKFFIHQS